VSHRLPAVALTVVVLAMTGCGTTVSTSLASRSAAHGLSAPNGTADPSAVTAGTLPTSAGTAAAPSGGSSLGATTVGASVDTQPGASAAAPMTTVGRAPGVTAKSVFVGITYTTNGDAANAAIGAAGITSGDEKADAQAVIDDINAHGGVAGRKLVPVFHAYDANSQQTRATQDQAACSDFTQDHHVAAVVGIGLSPVWNACFTKARVVDANSGTIIDPDQAVFRQYPYYIDAGTIAQDRADAELARTLVRLRYFDGWNATTGQPAPGVKAKIGVLGVDVPEWNRPLEHVLLPALRAAGHSVAASDVRRIYNPQSTAEDGQTLASIQNAVLQFRQDGVTHVILLDTGGQLLTFFGKDAKSQHYYPRYGLHSGSGVQAIYDAGLVDADQLNGAVGLGWDPGLDLSATASAKYDTSATRHCLAVMKQRTGQTYTSTNAASLALSYCDEIYLLARAVGAAGPVINGGTIVHAVEEIGSGFVPAALPAAYFGPGRHDAVELGYDLEWDNSCTCARYTSPARRIP
jgi:hypothetical protein